MPTDELRSKWLTAPLFVIAGLFIASIGSGADYYIDSVAGDDVGNDGLTQLTPWASHTKAETTSLAPGDTVHFKRGSSFSGPIEIGEDGTAGSPILLTAYGTGDLPKFTNPDTNDENGNCIRLNGDYIIVENLHFHDTPGDPSGWWIMTRLGALRIMRYADHCIIRDNVFMKTGQGIISAGEHTLITRNYMDGPSFALWRSADSSWGPMGIHLNIGNQEVSYNTIKNFATSDSPWGSDGGAIEIDNGNYHKQNIYIHHNYSEGNAGFIESSWDYDWPRYQQEVYDWRVSFNVCYDGQSWLFMLAPCTGVYFDNNTVARYNSFGRSQNWGARMDVQGGSPVGVASGAHFRNNLFIYAPSGVNPYGGNRSAGALKTKNWYSNYPSFDVTYGGDGNQAGSGDPQLVDLGNGNYNLMAGSPLRGAGVNLSADYPGAVDFNGQPLPATGNWDIGAMQYTSVPTYTVTFDEGANGSRTGGGALVQVVNDGAAATAPVITPYAGFTFDGWDVPFDNVTSDLAVTAQYTQIMYTVTFVEGANGSRSGGGALVQTVAHGAAATAPVITPDTGYTFDDWDVPFDNVTSDLTVTAQYSQITYTVTFVEGANGSRSGGGALVQTVAHGAAATAPVITPDTDHLFDGWDVAFDNVTSDLTVTAQYSPATCPYITAAPTATPDVILLGDDSTLTVTATDPNGDPLTYTWDVSSGPGGAAFSPNGTTGSDTTSVTPDSVAGTYTLEVTVSDGPESVVGVVDLLVLDPADDFDLDGLTNAEEIAAGLDPTDPDTDGDGMPDGWELANDLDPLGNDGWGDPDGDEFTNLEEYLNGTDPHVADDVGVLGGGIGCAGGGPAARGSLALFVLVAFGLVGLRMRARSAFRKSGP